jgi:hypothetical protein
MGGFVGGLAVFMLFALPIAAIVGTLIIIGMGIRRRHHERMKMIEQGILPPPPRKRKGNYFALLITGAILFAFGIGMFLVGNISEEGDMTPGLIFGFVGLAMITCFIIIRRLNRKERESLEADNARPQTPLT